MHGAATQAAQELLAELVSAVEAERAARSAVSQARARQLRGLQALKTAGISMDRVAHRLETLQGRVSSLEARLRVAASLRKRLSRAGVTPRHAVQSGIGGAPETAPVALSQTAQEAAMPNDPKLIKRTTTTTTEEFADDLDVDDLDGLHEDDECEPGSKGTDKADEQRSRRK